jgi:hypothetical protein
LTIVFSIDGPVRFEPANIKYTSKNKNEFRYRKTERYLEGHVRYHQLVAIRASATIAVANSPPLGRAVRTSNICRAASEAMLNSVVEPIEGVLRAFTSQIPMRTDSGLGRGEIGVSL